MFEMTAKINNGLLIECVRKFPCIYDKSHGDYRNKKSKEKAWKNISSLVGVSDDLCEQRWIILRNRFATELRRRKNTTASVIFKPWRHSGSMSFMEDHIFPRKSKANYFKINSDNVNLVLRDVKPEIVEAPETTSSAKNISSEGIVTIELGSSSSACPHSSANKIRLRPIAPRPASSVCSAIPVVTALPKASEMQAACPTSTDCAVSTVSAISSMSAVPTVARLIPIPNRSESSKCKSIQNNASFTRRSYYNEQDIEDEDILFGKSIGHSLKNIRNKKVKLQVKSEILTILAKYSD